MYKYLTFQNKTFQARERQSHCVLKFDLKKTTAVGKPKSSNYLDQRTQDKDDKRKLKIA